MAYNKHYWTNDTGQTLDAEALNIMENGINDAHNGSKLKILYEGESNTNAYTDAEKLKLAGLGDTDVADRVTVNEADILALESDVAGLTGDVVILETTSATQDADIDQLEVDVVANESDILLAEARLDALEGVALPFTPFWAGSRIEAQTLTLDTYVEVNRLTTGILEAGTYGFIHTAVSNYDTTQRSGYCRISPDGGVTWLEFNNELKDITDKKLMTCSNFMVLAVPGVIDIIVQGRCETTGDNFTIINTVLQLERKL